MDESSTQPESEQKMVIRSFALPADLADWLDRTAEQYGISTHALARIAISAVRTVFTP